MIPGRFSRRTFLIGFGAAATAGTAYLSSGLIRDSVPIPLELDQWADLTRKAPFDVCIIGSGPAGTVLAQDLSDRGFRSVVLESGLDLQHQPYDERLSKLDVFTNSGDIDYPVSATRIRALGGTTAIWTGRCTRFHPLDFQKSTDYLSSSSWPITYSELRPFYRHAERTLRVRAGRLSDPYYQYYDGLPPRFTYRSLSPLNSYLQQVGVAISHSPVSQKNIFERDAVRIARDFVPRLSTTSNTTIVTGATVVNLVTDSQGNISEAHVQSLDGQAEIVQARVFVIACGGLESARLLLNSRSPFFPDGIGNRWDQVGRCFMEHPNLSFHGTMTGLPNSSYHMLGRSYQYYEQFKRKGLGGVVLVISWNPNYPQTLSIGATIEMQPSDMNRVVLNPEQTDHFGMPGAKLFMKFTDLDLETLQQTRALIRRIYADLSASDVEELDITWSHHHMGTCRMGDHSDNSVVDSNLRVHDSPNLYVLGSAVFAAGGVGHPTLAIVALSHRMADHLASILPHA
jgi:choline dehydrogenase-like flavoprotein